MLNQRIYGVALWAPLMIIVGCSVAQKKIDVSPLRLLIGDGGVRIEESYSHAKRETAAFESKHSSFQPSTVDLVGVAWVEESSEYELLPKVNSKMECHVVVSREKKTREPAAKDEMYTYKIDVKVSDGINNGPFETIINGENEGIVLLGEYPVNNWQSTENIEVNDTVIVSWYYEPKEQRYEIVKKMGEDRFIKKVLLFDPYLKNVKRVKYEILKGTESDVDQQMPVLARLDCKV